MSKYIGLRDAANLAGVSYETARQAILKGYLRAKKFGKGWLIEDEDFNEYVDKLSAVYGSEGSEDE